MNYDSNVNNMLQVYVDDKLTRYGAYTSWYLHEGVDNRASHLYEILMNEFGRIGWPRIEGLIVRYYTRGPPA